MGKSGSATLRGRLTMTARKFTKTKSSGKPYKFRPLWAGWNPQKKAIPQVRYYCVPAFPDSALDRYKTKVSVRQNRNETRRTRHGDRQEGYRLSLEWLNIETDISDFNFENEWQSVRTKKDRSLDLTNAYRNTSNYFQEYFIRTTG